MLLTLTDSGSSHDRCSTAAWAAPKPINPISFDDANLIQIFLAQLAYKTLHPESRFQLRRDLYARASMLTRTSVNTKRKATTEDQQTVFMALCGMGLQARLETVTDDGYVSIDIALPAAPATATATATATGPATGPAPATTPGPATNKIPVAVLIGALGDFTNSGYKTGNPILKEFLLETRGWKAVTLDPESIRAAAAAGQIALTTFLTKHLLTN